MVITLGGTTFDALVFGYYDGDKLIYAARTRNGFTPMLRADLMKKFKPLHIRECGANKAWASSDHRRLFLLLGAELLPLNFRHLSRSIKSSGWQGILSGPIMRPRLLRLQVAPFSLHW